MARNGASRCPNRYDGSLMSCGIAAEEQETTEAVVGRSQARHRDFSTGRGSPSRRRENPNGRRSLIRAGLDVDGVCVRHSGRVDAQVVGRDGPLAELERFLREIEGAPASLVIEGEPGIGKSTLWQRAVDVAGEREFVVLVSRPAESESALAYSGLGDLLARLDAAFLEDLPRTTCATAASASGTDKAKPGL